MSKSWIQSFSGLKIEPRALLPDMVKIEDIAHALAMKCRFTGHTREFYSVAQHCVLGSQQVPHAFKLAFLLHEISEAYLPDVNRPTKPYLSVDMPGGRISWSIFEEMHADVIMEALGFNSIRPLLGCPEVKFADMRMLATERDQMMAPAPDDWELAVEPYPDLVIRSWNPVRAETEFMNTFRELTR